jgi:hypothetical protein
VEVKHGVRVHLFNFYDNPVGNPAVPQKLRSAARRRRSRIPKFAGVVATSCWSALSPVITDSIAPHNYAISPVKGRRTVAVLGFKKFQQAHRPDGFPPRTPFLKGPRLVTHYIKPRGGIQMLARRSVLTGLVLSMIATFPFAAAHGQYQLTATHLIKG